MSCCAVWDFCGGKQLQSIVFVLHVDVKPGVHAPSLLHSQHLEDPQTTPLTAENKYQKHPGQNHDSNLEYTSLVQVSILLILPLGTTVNTHPLHRLKIDILKKFFRVRKNPMQ